MSTKKAVQAHTEIRIGISDSTQELNIESELSPEKILASVTESLNQGTSLIVVDVRGRQTIVPHNKISFVEIGETADRKVGFATI
ncbi:MAG: DUF3107 domain-containing protein [Actinomycetes bacterium]|jgi:hypothetical protein